MKTSGNAQFSYKYISPVTVINVRIWIRVASWANQHEFIRVNREADMFGTEIFTIWKMVGSLRFQNRFPNEAYDIAITWDTNTWVCFEARYVISSNAGEAKVWHKGVLKINRTGLNTAGAGSMRAVDFGTVYTDAAATYTVHYDDAVIDVQYIGTSTPPTYSNIGVSSTVAGSSTTFSCRWDDNFNLHKYIFSTNNTGIWVNDTTVTFSATPSWANVTKTLNSTAGLVIGYRWYANDTSNNLVSTGINTLTTSENNPPTYSSISINSTIVGSPCRFSVLWDDDYSLGYWIFSTNNTGVWVNDTAVAFSSTPAWANITKTLNSTVNMVIGYRWYANDTFDNWNNTGILTLLTSELNPPIYSNIAINSTVASSVCQFSILWNDDYKLGYWIFSTNNTGVWENDTAIAFESTPSWANLTKTLNSTISLVIGYRWYANDTFNNWNNTGILTLTTTSLGPTNYIISISFPSQWTETVASIVQASVFNNDSFKYEDLQLRLIWFNLYGIIELQQDFLFPDVPSGFTVTKDYYVFPPKIGTYLLNASLLYIPIGQTLYYSAKTVSVIPKPAESYSGPTYPAILTLEIIDMPYHVEYFALTTFEVTLKVTNKGVSYQGITISYWIVDRNNKRVYESSITLENQDLYDGKIITVLILCPRADGRYFFNAKATSLFMASAIVSDQFTVSVNPFSNIIEFFLTFFSMASNFVVSKIPYRFRLVIIIFVIVITYLALRKKHVR